jgi:hypothetical protein
VNLGSFAPGVRYATGLGIAVFAGLAWMASRRFWRGHPTVAMWVLFILVSLAAVTAGRAGFGVVYTARYALYSSVLVALALLSACALTSPWPARRVAAAILACALGSAAVTALSWIAVKSYSVNGKRLAKAVPATPEVAVQPYFGMFYPVSPHAEKSLVAAEKRGLYVPRVERVFATAVRMVGSLPANARVGGHLDRVDVSGNRLQAAGWTDIPAIVPQRTFLVFPSEGAPKAGPVATHERVDVAMATLHPNLEFGGFHFELEYASEELARRAAASLCIVVEAPSAGAAILMRAGARCVPASAAPP